MEREGEEEGNDYEVEMRVDWGVEVNKMGRQLDHGSEWCMGCVGLYAYRVICIR